MRYTIALMILAGVVSPDTVAAQPAPASTGTTEVLATVRITHSVLANGKPLPGGTYELRLANERPTPLVGQSPDAERWVEFVANERVVARERAVVCVTTICRQSGPPPCGRGSGHESRC